MVSKPVAKDVIKDPIKIKIKVLLSHFNSLLVYGFMPFMNSS